MTARRWTDPIRAVAERVTEGAGTDVLLLMCGHKIVVDHKRQHPKRKRCFQCRIWNTQK